MSDVLARPGVRLGARPERSVRRVSALDRFGGALEARLLRRHPGLRELREFEREVAEARKPLRGMSDTALAECRAELQRLLLRTGVPRALAARSFALVAEVSRRSLGLDPYAVQVMGGFALLHGMLAEMATGEGKTLTATLPVCTAALARVPVHVITVNDYLVERDARLMGPLYAALGLSVGTVRDGETDPAARRAAYACDVTYVTNKQIGFDYLRDRLAGSAHRSRLRSELAELVGDGRGGEAPLLRGLCYAIVDEADSVLVDEARTPLILSRTLPAGELESVGRQALELADRLQAEEDFSVDPRSRSATLTPAGRARVTGLASALGGVWRVGARRDELLRQALMARHVLRRDRDYLVRSDAVQLIDANTGRVMADRAWEGGLQQMIEAKEGARVTGPRETLARITYQRFYRRYLRLAGMTGTGREVARELWSVYGLATVTIPTHAPPRRSDLGTRLFATTARKWEAIADRVVELRAAGRPVLIGTQSVATSERLSSLLGARGVPHEVLNARQDAREAEIVARAGGRGCVTVATNMAGRGTDIALGPGVAEQGGLHVIVAERGEARRIDRQLIGRAARHGEPGSFERFESGEDEIARAELPGALLRALCAASREDGGRPWLARALLGLAQRAAEHRTARGRRALLRSEEELERALAFAGPGE